MKRLAALLITLPIAANAGLIGAEIDITAENGFSSGSTICKTGSASGVTVGGGDELTGSDWSGGCVGYYGADLSDNLLTLSGIEWGRA